MNTWSWIHIALKAIELEWIKVTDRMTDSQLEDIHEKLVRAIEEQDIVTAVEQVERWYKLWH